MESLSKRLVQDLLLIAIISLREKSLTYEYEILERITDPAKQFLCVLSSLISHECDASFENGVGIISLELPLTIIDKWNVIKTQLMSELLQSLSSLRTLEFREKYGEDMDDGVLYLFQDYEYFKLRLQEVLDPEYLLFL
jgi:hypothetical protein